MLGKVSIVGYDTVLYQRISIALWNLIMAASIDDTERYHIILVCSLWTTRSLAVSTIVNSHLLILGHIAPPDTSQHSISLVCCSFFVWDVTCYPRRITVHMIFLNLKESYTWIYSPDLGGWSLTISPYVSSGPNVSMQTGKLELKFS